MTWGRRTGSRGTGACSAHTPTLTCLDRILAAMATITPTPNGPYRTEGVRLLDKDGNVVKEGTLHLCRCGHSENKPFCDGHHSKVGFKG